MEIRWGIIAAIILYQVITIAGVAAYLKYRRAAAGQKEMTEDEFAVGGRSIGVAGIAVTLVLIMLGSGHTTGTFEGVHSSGVGQVWFILAHGVLLVVVCLGTGLWARRMRINSIGEFCTRAYGNEIAVLVAALNVIITLGILSCELQAMGILINGMAGLPLRVGAVIGGIIGILYIAIGGLKQSAYLNIFNMTIFYLSFVFAAIYMATALPGGNYDTIQNYYITTGQETMLSFTGAPGFIMAVGMPSFLSAFFCHATGQSMIQTCAAAKSEKTLRRVALFVAPLNTLIGAFSVTLALTARALPEYRDLDAKVYTIRMLIDYLPSWLLTMMLIAFIAALLSTIAGFALAASTSLASDFVKDLFVPKMTSQAYVKVNRTLIVAVLLVGVLFAQFLPPVLMLFAWLYSFGIPVFFIYLIGMWWKRSQPVAIATLLIPWALASLWTFTPLPTILGMENVALMWVILITTIVVSLVGNLAAKNAPKGYFRTEEWFKSEGYRIYLEEKGEGLAL
jgi:SSS family solute:Na+ symporter